MKFKPVKVTGLCDAECGKEASAWYGHTNKAHCGDLKCYKILDDDYKEHCKKQHAEWLFEQEMKDY